MGVRIINRQRVLLNPEYSVSDLTDVWMEGRRRGLDIQRSTGVTPSKIEPASIDRDFDRWWESERYFDTPLSKADARRQWIRGFKLKNPVEYTTDYYGLQKPIVPDITMSPPRRYFGARWEDPTFRLSEQAEEYERRLRRQSSQEIHRRRESRISSAASRRFAAL
jgi:hypothetical protein